MRARTTNTAHNPPAAAATSRHSQLTWEMPELKLTYFETRGRAEPTRLALYLSGLPFEDIRLSAAEFLEMRASTPYGSLPVLEVDGIMYAQSDAILRYVGGLGGLYPCGDVRALAIDAVLGGLEDAVGEVLRRGDVEAREGWVRSWVPRVFGSLEAALEERGGGDGWLVDGGLSVADLKLYACVMTVRSGVIAGVDADCLDGFENACAIVERVAKLPKVVEWEAIDHGPEIDTV